MRTALLSACLLAIAMALSLCAPASAPAEVPQRVDFQTQVRPILVAHCQPCHFAGGKMYARLPFDRPETIRTLGEKMFTRIKDEREVALIRSFLAQER